MWARVLVDWPSRLEGTWLPRASNPADKIIIKIGMTSSLTRHGCGLPYSVLLGFFFCSHGWSAWGLAGCDIVLAPATTEYWIPHESVSRFFFPTVITVSGGLGIRSSRANVDWFMLFTVQFALRVIF